MNSDVEKELDIDIYISAERVSACGRGDTIGVLRVWKREKKNEQQLLIEGDCCGAACIRLQNQLILVEKYSWLWRPHMCTHTLMNKQLDYC